MKRWILILVLLGLVAGGALAANRFRASRAAANLQDLQLQTIHRGPLEAVVGATGTVRARQQAQLVFQTSGIVDQVLVQVGDPVERGQVLATLEQTSLPQAIIMAQADLVAAQRALEDLLESPLARAQAQLALAQAQDALEKAEYRWNVQQEGHRASGETIAAAEANLILAEQEVERAEKEFNRYSGRPEDDPLRALARAKLAEARRKRDSILRNLNWYLGKPDETDQALLDAELEMARANLEEARRVWERIKDGPDPSEIAAAEARIAAAQATLKLARIEAPFAGTITDVDVLAGDVVNAGTPAFHIADLSQLFVDVQVTEVDINRLKPGQPVELIFDAAPGRTYEGHVVEVGLVGVPVQGVVNFEITVELLAWDEAVRPGLTAAVNIIVEHLEDVLLVPNRAVRFREGDRVVYVLRGGEPLPVRVELGASSELYSQVLAGDLQEGDQVILNPPSEFEQDGPPFFR
jgi:HlyD family secretion protein